jgi:hypothetical protein
MKRASRALVFGAAALLVASLGSASEPPQPYRPPARVAHIQEALTALHAAPPAALQQGVDYARTLSRGACSAGVDRLRVECMMVATRRYCHDRGEADAQRCAAYMDVVVSNVLADERLIPPDKRYEIVRENVDYRAALALELRRIQGTLAVDFRLRTGDAEDDGALAAKIDGYCLASTDETKFSYQTCVSSLAWFIRGPQ